MVMTNRSFTAVLCDFRRHFRLLFMITFLSIVILFVSLQYVEPGSETYVIALVQLVTFGVIFLGSVGMMVLCGRRAD